MVWSVMAPASYLVFFVLFSSKITGFILLSGPREGTNYE